MGFYDDLDQQRTAPAPVDTQRTSGFFDDLDTKPVPLPQPRPSEATQQSLPYRAYRALGGRGVEDQEPPQLPSFDTSKASPSERLSSTIGFGPTLGLQLFPPTGAVLGGLDLQYHTNRGEFGSAALEAPASMTSGAKVLRDVAKEGFIAPTSKDLLKIGGDQISQYRALPKTYVGTDVEALANSMKTGINAGEKAAPITHEAIDTLLTKAKKSPFVTPEMIDDFRVATSEASKKGEAGAMKARDLLYGYLEKTGDPADKLLMTGIKNYAGGKRGEIVDTILRKGAGYSNEGQKLDAAARSLVDNSAKRLRGFSNAEVAALDEARSAGARTFATGDVLSGRSLLSQAAPFGNLGLIGAGLYAGGVPGAAAGAVPAAVSMALRRGGTGLRREAIEDVGNLVRGRSPAGEAARLTYEKGPIANQAGRQAVTQVLLNQAPQNVDESQGNWLLDKTVNPLIYGGM